MSKTPLHIEDIFLFIVAGGAFIVLITVVTISFTGKNKQGYVATHSESVPETVFNSQPKNEVVAWEFKHCTSTNKECGRLE